MTLLVLLAVALWLVAIVPFICLAVAAARGDEMLAEEIEAERARRSAPSPRAAITRPPEAA